MHLEGGAFELLGRSCHTVYISGSTPSAYRYRILHCLPNSSGNGREGRGEGSARQTTPHIVKLCLREQTESKLFLPLLRRACSFAYSAGLSLIVSPRRDERIKAQHNSFIRQHWYKLGLWLYLGRWYHETLAHHTPVIVIASAGAQRPHRHFCAQIGARARYLSFFVVRYVAS